MTKNLKSKLLLLLIPIFLILGVITYAWFAVINKTDPIIIATGSLRVDAKLYYKTEVSGTYTEVEDGGINLNYVIPGKKFYFKLEITNIGSIPGELTVEIINITYTDEGLEGLFDIFFVDPSDVDELEISKSITGDELLLFSEAYIENGEDEKLIFEFVIMGNALVTEAIQGESTTLTSFLITLDQIRPSTP